MSYQFGDSCYATLADTAQAACAAFTPTTSVLANGDVATISCYSYNGGASGSLNMYYYLTSSTNPPVSYFTTSNRSYRTCREPEYVDAFNLILPSILVVLVVIWSAKKVMNFLDWSRGDEK